MKGNLLMSESAVSFFFGTDSMVRLLPAVSLSTFTGLSTSVEKRIKGGEVEGDRGSFPGVIAGPIELASLR